MNDADHLDVISMSPDLAQALPDADYILVVRMPRHPDGTADDEGVPTVQLQARPGLVIAPTSDLSGKTALVPGDAEIRLLPGDGEVMKIVAPDATVAYCTNFGQWRWLSARFTQSGDPA